LHSAITKTHAALLPQRAAYVLLPDHLANRAKLSVSASADSWCVSASMFADAIVRFANSSAAW